MNSARKLSLKKQTLAELAANDMRRVVAGDAAMTHRDAMSACGHPCLTDEPCITIPLKECVRTATAG